MDPIAKRRPLAGLKITSEDDPRSRKSYPALRQSLSVTRINNVPIFHRANGDVVDGNTRLAAMIELGLSECLAAQIPDDWTEADVLRFSIATDVIRRVMPPEELASKAQKFMDLTDSTQEAAARELGISPAHLSRAFTSLLLPAKLADLLKDRPASVRALIASEKDAGIQEELALFATTARNGKLPSRDQIELERKRLHKLKDGHKGRKPKHLKGEFEGRSFSMELDKDDSAEGFAGWLKALAKKLEKDGGNLPPEGWGLLFS